MKLNTFVLIILFALSLFLRVYKFTSVPPGLYMDEASIAYNAYSILKTGKDEHNATFPFVFQAFGEYKMPVFIYMTSFSIVMFGKNEFAVRIPSAFFGSITVLLFYFFAKELIRYEKKLSEKQQALFSFLSAFLLAVSPWHLQFSRAGFEAIVALFFYLAGLLFFLYFYREKRKSFLLVSFLFLVVSMYSYNAFLVIGLLSAVSLCIFILFLMKLQGKTTALMGLIAFFCALPMILFALTPAGQARFSQVTAFSPQARFLLYPLEYINNYLAYFSFSFLFSLGDGIGRHSAFRTGPLFKWEMIFLLIGAYVLIKEKKSIFTAFILFLMFVSPTAAALALPSPHVLRSLSLVLSVTLLLTYGIVKTLQQKRHLFLGIVALIAIFEGVLYVDNYYGHANVTLNDWGGQYKELITKIANHSKKDTVIIVNDNVGMNRVYVKFYHPEMSIITVGNTWTKPRSLEGKNVLYVTAQGDKNKKIPYAFIDSITTPDKYHDVLYMIWEI